MLWHFWSPQEFSPFKAFVKLLTFSLCKPSIHILFSLAGCCVFPRARIFSDGVGGVEEWKK